MDKNIRVRLLNGLSPFPKEVTRRWSVSAVECYERGCVCENCRIFPEYLHKQCRMKLVVRELVRVLGAPKKQEVNNDC